MLAIIWLMNHWPAAQSRLSPRANPVAFGRAGHTMRERRLSIDMVELGAAFENASDAVRYYLDLESGAIIIITDEIRDELEMIYAELDDEQGVADNAFGAALQQRDLPAWMHELLDEAHRVEQGYGQRYIAIP